MENNRQEQETRIKAGDPEFKEISIEKISSSVFRCQLLAPKYCADLCDEIKRLNAQKKPSVDRIDAHELGLDEVVTKIVDVLVPQLALSKAEESLFFTSAAYITIHKSIRPSHKRFRTNSATFIVDINLGDDFTGGELMWLNTDSYHIEAKEPQTAGKAVIYAGHKLHGARAITTGERINLVIELKKTHSFHYFNELSPELKRYMLRYLDVTGLCSLSQTCHELKTIIYAADSEWAIPEEEISNRAGVVEKYANKIFTAKTSEQPEIENIIQIGGFERSYAKRMKRLYEAAFVPIFTAIPELNEKFGVVRVALQHIAEAHQIIASDLELVLGSTVSLEFVLISLCTIYSSLIGVLPFYTDYFAQYYKLIQFKKFEMTSDLVYTFTKEFQYAESDRVPFEAYLGMPIGQLLKYETRFGEVLGYLENRDSSSLPQIKADLEEIIESMNATTAETSPALSKAFNPTPLDPDVVAVGELINHNKACIMLSTNNNVVRRVLKKSSLNVKHNGMEKNNQTRIKVADPEIKEISIEKTSSSVFRCQLLAPKYCADLCDEIKRLSTQLRPNVDRIEAHELGLDEVVTKIVDVLVPQLALSKAEESQFFTSAAYVTIHKSIRPSHKRFRTNPASLIVDLNLGDDFTGGELMWLNPDSYVIEAQEPQTAGKAVIYYGHALHGTRAILTGERINLVIELKKTHSFHYFNELSPELKRYMLRCLDVTGLCSLSQTCHQLKTMIYAADSEWAIPEEEISNRAGVVEKYANKKIIAPTTKIGKIIRELIDTEISYSKYLKRLYEVVFAPIYDAAPKLNMKFGVVRVALQRIAEAHQIIASELELVSSSTVSSEFMLISLCTIYSSLIGVLPFYADYLTQYNKLLEIIKLDVKTNNKRVLQFARKFREQDPHKMSIEGYLVMPVSRLPRYQLLLQEMIRSVKTDAATLQNVADAEKLLEAILATIKEASAALNEVFSSATATTDQDLDEVNEIINDSKPCALL